MISRTHKKFAILRIVIFLADMTYEKPNFTKFRKIECSLVEASVVNRTNNVTTLYPMRTWKPGHVTLYQMHYHKKLSTTLSRYSTRLLLTHCYTHPEIERSNRADTYGPQSPHAYLAITNRL